MKKTIGIIGGMGPLATADLFRKIVENTPAVKDQDHIHVIIDNNTDIPDRTAALLNGGEDPLPQMLKSGKTLQNAGADALIMPCNTAHAFYDALCAELSVPVLNMISLTCDSIRKQGMKKVGLLATTGTIRTGVYRKYAGDLELVLPDEKQQEDVMQFIYSGVKAGDRDFDAVPFLEAAKSLLEKGAETIILGCTELPVGKEMYGLEFPSVDPTLELAKGAIRFALD